MYPSKTQFLMHFTNTCTCCRKIPSHIELQSFMTYCLGGRGRRRGGGGEGEEERGRRRGGGGEGEEERGRRRGGGEEGEEKRGRGRGGVEEEGRWRGWGWGLLRSILWIFNIYMYPLFMFEYSRYFVMLIYTGMWLNINLIFSNLHGMYVESYMECSNAFTH